MRPARFSVIRGACHHTLLQHHAGGDGDKREGVVPVGGSPTWWPELTDITLVQVHLSQSTGLLGLITKYRRRNGLNNRNVLSHSLAVGSPNQGVGRVVSFGGCEGRVHSTPLSLAYRCVSYLCLPIFPPHVPVSKFPLLRGHQSRWIKDPPNDLILT